MNTWTRVAAMKIKNRREFSVECVVIVKKAEATDIRTVSPQLS